MSYTGERNEEAKDMNLPVDMQKLVLATLLTTASSLPAHGAIARPAEPSTHKAAGGYRFSYDTLLEEAKRLAAKPYAPQRSTLPAGLDKLSPEQYRSIHFNRDAAIWRNENLPFRLELLRTTFNQQAPPVIVSTVEGDTAHDLVATPAMFEIAPSLPQLGKVSLPLSGFRLVTQINSKKIWDEFLVFQGASYFRGVSKGLLYGLSARGLAINTAEPAGEEFPAFTHFLGRAAGAARHLDRDRRASRERVHHGCVPLHRATGRCHRDGRDVHVVPALRTARGGNRASHLDVSVRRDQSRPAR